MSTSARFAVEDKMSEMVMKTHLPHVDTLTCDGQGGENPDQNDAIFTEFEIKLQTGWALMPSP